MKINFNYQVSWLQVNYSQYVGFWLSLG